MYERNAIVLERYFEKKFGFDKPTNLKTNYTNYSDLIEELEKYQVTVEEEKKIIQEFDEIAKKIQIIQKTQEKLCATNEKLEEERNKLFNILDEDPSNIENRLEKIENTLEKNNEELKKLRIEFIEALKIFEQEQKERNRCAKERRIVETNHVNFLQKITRDFKDINGEDILKIKNFLGIDKEIIEDEIYQILMKNGKSERVPFSLDAMKLASKARIQIAEKEVECYLLIYDKFIRLLQEIENENLKLSKYQKNLRDVKVKLAFLKAEKEYIVGFLDNERMVAINGNKVHHKMMEEACNGFETDIIQIDNLYELILKEVTGKSTKKAYRELYNKTYLKNIEEKEKNFEQEVNHINISMGTVINANYWRIEGIKNIYNVFQEEVSEKFNKDLSEFKIEEPKEIEETIKIGGKTQEKIKIFQEDDNGIEDSDNYDEDFNNDDDWEDDWDDEEVVDDWDDEEDIEEWDDENSNKKYNGKNNDYYKEELDIEEESEIEFDDEEDYDEEDDWDEEDYDEEDDWDEENYDEEDDWDEEDYDEEYDWDDEEDDNFIIDEEDRDEGEEEKKNKINKKNSAKKRNAKEKIDHNEQAEEIKGLFNKFFKNKKK